MGMGVLFQKMTRVRGSACCRVERFYCYARPSRREAFALTSLDFPERSACRLIDVMRFNNVCDIYNHRAITKRYHRAPKVLLTESDNDAAAAAEYWAFVSSTNMRYVGVCVVLGGVCRMWEGKLICLASVIPTAGRGSDQAQKNTTTSHCEGGYIHFFLGDKILRKFDRGFILPSQLGLSHAREFRDDGPNCCVAAAPIASSSFSQASN